MVGVVLVSLHVVSVNQGLDPLLQIGRLDGEGELVEELGEEQGVAESLPHLHDSDYRGVNLVLSVLKHSLLSRLLLVIGLLQLDLKKKNR